MSVAAKKPAKSDARAASIASFMSAMGEPRKVVPKKEAAVVVVDDDDADDTFASFAEREKKKILDLGIEPDEEYLNAEINRRWEMSGRGKSVALKAKASSKGSATVTSSKVVKPEKKEKDSAEDGGATMHMIDTKLDAATAKAMGVEFAGEIKGKFLYKNIEAKDVQEGKEGTKANESKTEVAKPSSVAAAKPKPSPKVKSSPPPKASSSGSSKKRKAEEKAAKSEKKAKLKDEEVDFGDLAQSAEHWTQVAAGRLMVKCADNAEARAHIQGLLNVFGVTLSAKVLASKSVSLTEVSELARQMHYETDNGEDEEEEEEEDAPHEDMPHYFVGKDDSDDDEAEDDEEADSEEDDE